MSRLSQGAQLCLSARTLQSEAVIASAQTGDAVREVAYYRPPQSIIAITDDVLTAVSLLQHRGVYPVVMEQRLLRTVDEFIDIAHRIHQEIGIPVPKGDDKKDYFRLPGLLRIEPADAHARSDIPNSLHEFRLPVAPTAPPEVERKYVLTAAAHARLEAALRLDAASWKSIRQKNSYFTDAQGLLEQARFMVRLRSEHVEQRKEPVDGDGDQMKVHLTLKGPAIRRADGFEERPEYEFDVTREYLSRDVLSLTAVCRRHITKHCRLLLEKYGDPERIEFKLLTTLVNHRQVSSMYNSFTLELDRLEFQDAAKTPNQYELEVEFLGGEGQKRELDEYIHDKFARLGIPLVTDYPSKVARAYLYAGLLTDDEEALHVQIKAAQALAEQSHEAGCERCRNVHDYLAAHPRPVILDAGPQIPIAAAEPKPRAPKEEPRPARKRRPTR